MYIKVFEVKNRGGKSPLERQRHAMKLENELNTDKLDQKNLSNFIWHTT